MRTNDYIPMVEDSYINYLENKSLKHLVVDGSGRVPIDHADEIKGAGYFVGSHLVAKHPVTILSHPIDGKVVKSIPTGGQVGTIFSYVDNTPDGSLWWQLNGTNGVGGFVKHEKGAFDTNIAVQTSSGKTFDDTMAAIHAADKGPLDDLAAGFGSATSGIGNALKGFGENLNMIIILVLVLAAAIAMYKLFKL